MSPEEARKERIKCSHAQQKQNNSGFYSSQQQSQRGKKGGAKITPKKIEKWREKLNPLAKKRLDEGTVWQNPRINTIVEILPGQAELINDFYSLFLDALPECEFKEEFKKINQGSFNSGIGKVLKGVRKTSFDWSLVEDLD